MSPASARILVAEDNRVLSDVLKFNLLGAGFDVTTALDGLEAIQHLRSHSFELMMTDFQMPGVNGEQLIRFTREEIKLTKLPIVVCSAKGLELDQKLFRDQWNVAEIVYKPFSMREIIKIVSREISEAHLPV